MSETPSADPVVLERLLRLQSALGAARHDQGWADCLVAGLASLPGLGGVAVCKEGGLLSGAQLELVPPVQCREAFQAGAVDPQCPRPCPGEELGFTRLGLRGPRHHYGGILLRVTDPAAFAPYQPWVEQTLHWLGLLLDNREWEAEARAWQGRLEAHTHAQAAVLRREGTERKRAEEALRQSDDKHRALFETMTQGVIYQDGAGGIISANPAAQRILGLTFDQLRGHTSVDPCWKAIHEDGSDFPGEMHPAMVALRTGVEVRDVVMGIFNPRCGDHVWLSVNAVPQFRPGEATPSQVYTTFTDITRRKRAEAELDKVRGLLAAAVEQSPAGILIADAPDVRIRLVNSAALGIRGAASHPLSDIPVALHPRNWQTFHPDGQPCLPEELPLSRAVLAGQVTHNAEVIIRRSDGEDRWVLANAAPVRNPRGEIVAGVVVFLDITERKRAEAALRFSEEKYTKAFRSSPDAVVLASLRDGRIIEVNDGFVRLTGYSTAEVLGQSTLGVSLWAEPSDRAAHLVELRDKGHVYGQEFQFRLKSGQVRTGMVSAELIHVHGEPCSLSVTRDITERKQAEQALRASLEEKEALLKEVHHRVKNNLQIISSLVHLQARQVSSPEVQVVLRDTQSRLRAMALLHETLYGSGNLARVSFRHYVESVCAHLGRSYGSDTCHIQLRADIAEVGLPLEQAIPAGLIINELVSNAFKHAFVNRADGEIAVRLQAAGPDRYALAVSDNGVGLPRSADTPHLGTLGLRLVEALARQLGGELTVHREVGTTFRIVFPTRPE